MKRILPTYKDFLNESLNEAKIDPQQKPFLKGISDIANNFFSDLEKIVKKHKLEIKDYDKYSFYIIDPELQSYPTPDFFKRNDAQILKFTKFNVKGSGKLLCLGHWYSESFWNAWMKDLNINDKEATLSYELGLPAEYPGKDYPVSNKIKNGWQYSGNILTDDDVKSYKKELDEMTKFLDDWFSKSYKKYKSLITKNN